jgi:DtxR family Mn-dependent transcriptional regulator
MTIELRGTDPIRIPGILSEHPSDMHAVSGKNLASPQTLFTINAAMSSMEPDDGLRLSPRKVEYLKYLFGQDRTVRTNEIAAHYNIDPSTVTKTSAELADSGYLSHIPYRGVCLTKQGKRCAEFLIKRHRILSLALFRYGLSDEQACREVSRFESLVSREAIDTMCRAMGHPSLGICGEITHDKGCMTGQVDS